MVANCIPSAKYQVQMAGYVCCKKHCSHQKCCGDMGCAVVQQACREVRTSPKYQSDLQLAQCGCASCIGSLLPESCSFKDLVAVYLPQVLNKAPELQVRLKFCVVNKVSIFLIITLLSSGLKYVLIFSTFMLRQVVWALQNPVSPQVPFCDGKYLPLSLSTLTEDSSGVTVSSCGVKLQ